MNNCAFHLNVNSTRMLHMAHYNVHSLIHCLKKNVISLSSYNFHTCELILIILGRNVDETVSN